MNATQTPRQASKSNTLVLERHMRAPPERVYKAFIDPEAMVKWLPPYGFTGKVHAIDPRVGGSYRMSFTNFGTGKSHSFSGRYVELTPSSRIRYNDTFDDPNLPGTMEVTIEIRPSSAGSFVRITQAGIPGAIPVEFATMGWQESLLQLAALVEPDVPDDGPGS